MASVTASHLILFIASLMVAASVAGTFTSGVGKLSDAVADQSYDVSNDIRTDVEIISDPGAPVYNISGNENVSLLVKNTGTRELPTDSGRLDVLVDGRYQTDVSMTVVDGANWGAGNVVRIEVRLPGLAAGDHRVRLIVNEESEVFTFRT